MSREFTFREELIGPSYKRLLDYAVHQCNTFSLVTRHSLPLSDRGEAALQALSPFLIKQAEVDSWPGTMLLNDTASLLKYVYNAQSAAILKEISYGLFQWLQPDLPEDLCLYNSEGSVWLASISHEEDVLLYLDQSGVNDLIDFAPDLYALLITQ